MHVPGDARDALPVRGVLEPGGDDVGEDDHHGSAWGGCLVREHLRVGEGDGVEDELERGARGELLELGEDRRWGEGAVEDVRGAEGGEEVGVAGGGGGDDGREVGELRDLDGWQGGRSSARD